MNLSCKQQIFAILLINCAFMQSSKGEDTKYQLKLAEIFTDAVQLTSSGDNQYELRINQPDSQRVETIAVAKPLDTAQVVVINNGEIRTNYPNENLNLVMKYVADANGYRASYRLGKQIANNKDEEVFFEPRLNIKDLKTLAG